MIYIVLAIVGFGVVAVGWKLTSRTAYESADYRVIQSDSAFEVREYPSLTLATTSMSSTGKGDDGSFGRLFSYISGNNQDQQKISMTTPVFMDMDDQSAENSMGFVMPVELTETHVPSPSSDQVSLQDRPGGKFAVYRFSGRINQKTISNAEDKLRNWMADNDLDGTDKVEVAGYDPPWTPGPFRRNEVLIKLK